MKRGRPFRQLPLSEFDDRAVIEEIIEYVVAHFGAQRAKAKWALKDSAWRADVSQMVDALRQISCGHPLVMAEVLRYTAKEDRFMHPTFLTDKWIELCLRCLIPIVGGRILPTIDRMVREAFRSLCIFRYVWLDLISTLTNPTTDNDLGLWKPFSTSRRSGSNWWFNLQETHLIYQVSTRQIYPISPVIRQVISHVLQAEDQALYRARHGYARQEYEQLLDSQAITAARRAACLLEVFYHATQDGTLNRVEAATLFKNMLNDFLNALAINDSLVVGRQLKDWLGEDTELEAVISQFTGPELYVELLQSIEHFLKHQQENNHE